MTDETTTETADLLTRDGHLGELTVNRILAGELDGPHQTFVDDHVAQCDGCRARLDAVKRADELFSISPPVATPANVVSLDEQRAKRGPIFALLAIAAAIACVVFVTRSQTARVAPGEPDDGIRLKGSDLSLEVYAKSDDAAARLVGDGDIVNPGERLGFKVSARKDGYLMIVGIDARHEVYPAWPTGGGDATFWRGEDARRDVKDAIRLDDVGNQEKLVLIQCARPFDFGAAQQHFAGAPALANRAPEDPLASCMYDDVTLSKRSRSL